MSADGIMMGVFGRRAAKLGKDAKYVSPSRPCLHPVQRDFCSTSPRRQSSCLGILLHARMFHGCTLACRALAQAEKKLEDGELKQEHKAAPAIQGQDNTDRTPEQLEHQEEEPPQVRFCAGQVHSKEHIHPSTI